MKVESIMTREVESIRPDQMVSEAARKMRDLNVGILPVTSDSSVSAVVTDRDIVIRAIAQGLDPKSTRVEEISTTDIEWAHGEDDVDDVLEKMEKHKIRRMPVVDRNNDLVGIVSIGDIAVEGAEDEDEVGEALKEISSPNRPRH